MDNTTLLKQEIKELNLQINSLRKKNTTLKKRLNSRMFDHKTSFRITITICIMIMIMIGIYLLFK